jgi:hypothetical protein
MLAALFAVCTLPALAVSAISTRGAQTAEAARSRITIALGVRVRVAPQVSAEEVGRLQLGTVIRELERTASRERIGASEDYWYRVAAPGVAEGWVFGGLIAAFDPNRRAEIYQRIAAERLKVEGASFADQIDLVRFLDRAVPEVSQVNAAAELELLRLLALRRSLASVAFEKQAEPPYDAWLKEQQPRIVYSEPAGQWHVLSELFWNLRTKYRALPVAERIAWEAAQNPLPGECEGFLPCYFGYYNLTHIEYLRLYPRGAHADESLADFGKFLDGVFEDFKGQKSYDVPRADRAEFKKTLAKTRLVISKVPGPRRTTILRQLDELARRFR